MIPTCDCGYCVAERLEMMGPSTSPLTSLQEYRAGLAGVSRGRASAWAELRRDATEVSGLFDAGQVSGLFGASDTYKVWRRAFIFATEGEPAARAFENMM